jgi:SAM-dependent methyltransferase
MAGAEPSHLGGLFNEVPELVPSADLRHGDIEELPFDNAAFDADTAFNAVQYATDPATTLRKIRRVAKPGSSAAVVTWGTADQCEMRVVIGAIGALLPPPPPGAGGPFALAAPGALDNVFKVVVARA